MPRAQRTTETRKVQDVKFVDTAAPANTYVYLNFMKYYKDLYSTRNAGVIPLSVQYRHMSATITNGESLPDFLKRHIYDKGEPADLFICHPSFDKSNKLEKKSLELRNVSVRMQSRDGDGDSDLMMTGNFELETEGWQYCVTRFSIIRHVDSYYGEIQSRCAVYCATSDSSDKVFFDANGRKRSRKEFITSGNNVIDVELVNDLCKTYIVPNPENALRFFSDWEDFLRYRSGVVTSEDLASGFQVSPPVVFEAYSVPRRIPHDPSKVIISEEGVDWTEEVIRGSALRAVVRITCVLKPTADRRKRLEDLRNLIKDNVNVIDPAGDDRDLTDDDRARIQRLSKPGTLIGMSTRTLDPPEAKRNRLDESLKEDLRTIDQGYADLISSSSDPDEVKRLRKEQGTKKRARIRAHDEEAGQLSDLEVVMFFKVPSRDGISAGSVISERRDYYGSCEEFVLCKDLSREMASLKRLSEALSDLKNGRISNPHLTTYLFMPEVLPIVNHVPIDHLFGSEFNEAQRRAIADAVSANGMYLIQGPPGTGKTQVIAEITAQEVIRGRKVLITSQGNKAIDNAFERLKPYSFVHPVRLMAENKTNDFEFKKVVSIFYSNQSVAMEDQLRMFEDEDFKSTVYAKMDTLEELLQQYSELNRSLETMRNGYENRRKKILKKFDALSRDRSRYSEYAAIQDRMSSLPKFRAEDYADHRDEILALFDGRTEDEVFGEEGLCSVLCSTPETDIENADGADAVTTLLKCYGTERRADIRDRLMSIQNEIRDALQAASDLHPDVRKNLEAARYELDHLIDDYPDPDFHRLMELDGRIRDETSELFGMLRITDTPAKDRIDPRWITRILKRTKSILNVFEAKPGETAETFSEIISYLRTCDEPDNTKLRDRLISYPNVFGITCTANQAASVSEDRGRRSADIDLKEIGIDTVIVDEVSKVPFSELIRPISWGMKIILVGDHKQLPPVYNEEEADDTTKDASRKRGELYTTSLFESLFNRTPDDSKVMLTKQYRMAPQIMGVINRFYDMKLEMGCRPEDKLHRLVIDGVTRNLVSERNSVLFVNCTGKESIEFEGGHSFVNKQEADVTARLVRLIDRACRYNSKGILLSESDTDRMSMGVITPYAAQVKLIESKLHLRSDGASKDAMVFKGFQPYAERQLATMTEEVNTLEGYESYLKTIDQPAENLEIKSIRAADEGFMVKSVDDFQGDERDVIIISLVRTRRSSFISDFRRINVGMSRARRLLVLVGNAEALESQEVLLDGEFCHVYHDIIEDIRAADSFVDASEVPEVDE